MPVSDEVLRVLNQPIRTREDGERFCQVLEDADLMFHFDDDTRDIITRDGTPLFTEQEAHLAHVRRCELYAFDWGEYECPIGYVLHISGHWNAHEKQEGAQ